MKSFVLTVGLLAMTTSVAAHATFQESWHGATDDAKSCAREPVSAIPKPVKQAAK